MQKLFLIISFIVSCAAGMYTINTSSAHSIPNEKLIEKEIKLSQIKRTEIIRRNNQIKEYRRQLLCLATNVYREAKNQPLIGMKAVAEVTLNRTADSRWPNDVCSVVYERDSRKCQFSWVCEGDKAIRPVRPKNRLEKDAWESAQKISWEALMAVNPEFPDYTYFHATYVSPNWKNVHSPEQIGAHIFYKG